MLHERNEEEEEENTEEDDEDKGIMSMFFSSSSSKGKNDKSLVDYFEDDSITSFMKPPLPRNLQADSKNDGGSMKGIKIFTNHDQFCVTSIHTIAEVQSVKFRPGSTKLIGCSFFPTSRHSIEAQIFNYSCPNYPIISLRNEELFDEGNEGGNDGMMESDLEEKKDNKNQLGRKTSSRLSGRMRDDSSSSSNGCILWIDGIMRNEVVESFYSHPDYQCNMSLRSQNQQQVTPLISSPTSSNYSSTSPSPPNQLDFSLKRFESQESMETTEFSPNPSAADGRFVSSKLLLYDFYIFYIS